MKTVIINQAFDVDAPKPARHQPGDEVTVSEAVAELWIAKGLAHAKVASKPEPKAAGEKPAPKSAD